jgi:AcrR family transcriptional regulator
MNATETPARELTGERARAIVDAMRDAVAEHGIAGATFERVSSAAGVSRGLLHYYFGTKERLLVEVVNRDAELRIERLDERLSEAHTPDEVIDALLSNLVDMLDNDPAFFALLFELFGAGRRNPEIRAELNSMFERTRMPVAEKLREKEREGLLDLPVDADAAVGLLYAVADGVAVQVLNDPDADHSALLEAAVAAARGALGIR